MHSQTHKNNASPKKLNKRNVKSNVELPAPIQPMLWNGRTNII